MNSQSFLLNDTATQQSPFWPPAVRPTVQHFTVPAFKLSIQIPDSVLMLRQPCLPRLIPLPLCIKIIDPASLPLPFKTQYL